MIQPSNRGNGATKKNIVICSDGTGNHDIKARGTNVFKLYEAVDIHGYTLDPTYPRQVAIYDNGVGTQGPLPIRAFCSAVGYGFSANVKHLYRSLLEIYQEGDTIYLFGFSRGAYSVRALSELIGRSLVDDSRKRQHLSDDRIDPLIDQSWRAFRRAAMTGDGGQSDCPSPKPLVKFLGVWDTVGAVGFPLVDLTRSQNRIVRWVFRWVPWFGDKFPSRTVERACQALALDDQRATFRPEIWREDREGLKVKQVWFAGAHANVGGGYTRQGISLVALDWMMREAEDAGLRFIATDRESVHAHRDVHDKLYDSRAGLGVYYRWQPRLVAALDRERGIDTLPLVHESVFQRIGHGTEGYSPLGVPLPCNVVYTNPPGSDSPTRIEKFNPPWTIKNLKLFRDHSEAVMAKIAAFFTDHLLMQVGIGALAGIFLNKWLLDSKSGGDFSKLLAPIISTIVAILTMVGLSLLRLVLHLFGSALGLIRNYFKRDSPDNEGERSRECYCLTEAVKAEIASGKRYYKLFVLTSLLAVGSLAFERAQVNFDGTHATLALGVLGFMVCSAWWAGAHVDKRISRVTKAFWTKENRARILEELAPTPASSGDGPVSLQRRVSGIESKGDVSGDPQPLAEGHSNAQ